MGLSQRDLNNVKELEETVLKLGEKLKPLSSAYTQSGSGEGENKNSDNKEGTTSKTGMGNPTGEGGRPQKQAEDKTEETIRTEESRN
jgi:hypothetical protein